MVTAVPAVFADEADRETLWKTLFIGLGLLIGGIGADVGSGTRTEMQNREAEGPSHRAGRSHWRNGTSRSAKRYGSARAKLSHAVFRARSRSSPRSGWALAGMARASALVIFVFLSIPTMVAATATT